MAIVALWAAVLIPMWLRRHDDDQARRLDRHRTAMGTLASMNEARSEAQVVAARRRRLVAGALLIPVALAVAAWFAGMASLTFVVAAALPFATYLVIAAVAGRGRARREADIAARQERRASVAGSARRVRIAPAATVDESPVIASPPTPQSARRTPRATFTEVFDQSA